MSTRNHRRNTGQGARRPPVVIAVGGLLAAAGGLHLAALPSHLESSAVAGAFFAVTALGQLLGAMLVVTRPSHRTTIAVVVGNLAVLAIWAVSRTTGLPGGGEMGTREPLAVLDGLAAAAEILGLAGLGTIIYRKAVTPWVPPAGSWRLSWRRHGWSQAEWAPAWPGRPSTATVI